MGVTKMGAEKLFFYLNIWYIMKKVVILHRFSA